MRNDEKILLQFVSNDDAKRQEEGEKLLRLLAEEVEELRLGATSFEYAKVQEGEQKSGPGLLEWLSVVLVASPALRELLRLAGQWAHRAKHPVRVRVGENELVLGNATMDQQNVIIEEFFARHHSS